MNYGVEQEQDWNALTDEAFRSLVRAEVETHHPTELRYPPRRLRWAENKFWYLRMAAKGWIAPGWPREYGGMGLSPAKLLIFLEEMERWGIARFQDHGILMVGPILMRFGTEARLEGDAFVINGQKTWTTLAHDATHMFVLARTDKSAKKQAGISFLLLDLSSPGVSVRPIRDLAGHDEFCEVFFDNARTPAFNLVGELNQGWTVAKSLLGFERIHIGSPKLPEYGLQVLLSVARARGVEQDALFRDRLAQLQLDVAHLGDIYGHFAAIVGRGEPLGAEVSLLKIWATETFQRIADLIIETAGDAGGLAGKVQMGESRIELLAPFYKARPSSIYGGSNEIQRNILARQVLNLPG